MALNGRASPGSLESSGELPVSAQEACPCGWVQVSWDELAQLCRRLSEQLQREERPDAVVALARAGYVPGAILASLLRCDLLTLQVPPERDRGGFGVERSAVASLGHRLVGRRVIILDEATRTGESLAWAARIAAGAGAAVVRTAVLFHPPGSPRPDYVAVASGDHILQPWIRHCL
jgi:hypoxanthine phosphoribosyltransferase